jgi:hypothetical protein
MAASFELKNSRATDFLGFMNGLAPNEVASVKPDKAIKALHYVSKLFDEFEAAAKPFQDLAKANEEKAVVFNEEVNAFRTVTMADPNLTEEAKREAVNAKTKEVKDKVNEMQKSFDLVAEDKVKVDIGSDDRFEWLKALVNNPIIYSQKTVNMRDGKQAHFQRFNGGVRAISDIITAIDDTKTT